MVISEPGRKKAGQRRAGWRRAREPRAGRTKPGATPAVVVAALLLLAGCGASGPVSPPPGSVKVGRAAFCAAAKAVATGLVGTGGPQALSAKTVPAIEKMQGALATMRAGAPAPIRSDVAQVTTAWSPVLADVVAGAKHPGQKPPASFAHEGSRAVSVLLGAPGTAIGAWADAHCPGYATTTPTALSTPTASSPAVPDLFVLTPSTRALYAWSRFPATIRMDDNDWIGGITWTAGPTGAAGSGASYTDLSCSGAAASCPATVEGTVELAATQPETCTVHFADQSPGALQSEQALVFDHLRYTVTSGPAVGRVYTFPSPCPGVPQPPGRCRASILSGSAYGLAGGGAAGSMGGAFGLVNHGTVACTLFGYPGMQLLGTHGRPLPTKVIRGQYEVVSVIPEQTVTVAPGAEVFFYFMYSDALGTGCPATCPETSAVEITPPGAYYHLVVSVHIAPSQGWVWVSPVTTSTPFPLTSASP